jgi:hypothetical protein
MAFKALLIIVVIAILMDDSASIKKTAKEEKEDRELAEKVNATLAEEEEKKKTEEEKKKTTDEKNQKTDKVKDQDEEKEDTKEQVGQGEDCPACNFTCPVVIPCQPCKRCPDPVDCRPCHDCPPCEECGACPEVKPCQPCHPCPGVNITNRDLELPAPPTCLETSSMSVPVALAIGACAGGLLTGVAAVLGLVIRYFSPIESGFIFLATIIVVWYLCSHHPETARELGGRAATLLREAASALSHRVVEALQRHNEQVGFS